MGLTRGWVWLLRGEGYFGLTIRVLVLGGPAPAAFCSPSEIFGPQPAPRALVAIRAYFY